MRGFGTRLIGRGLAQDLDGTVKLTFDVNLHGERTFPIVEALRQRGRAVVIVTGYADTVLPDSLRAVPVLRKPYRRQELERVVREAWQHG